jgi:hypothetical protein
MASHYQSAYAGKILDRYGMSSRNPSASPMESHLKLSKVGTEEAVNVMEYQSIISVLRYLLHTQPDLVFAIGYLSQFMEAPHTDHLAAVKRVLRYMVGTRHHRLHYTKREDEPPKLVVYNDADTRKSTSNIIFFLAGNPITWQVAK